MEDIDKFINDEISKLREKITKIEELQKEINNSTCSYRKASLFSRITRGELKHDRYDLEEITNKVWAEVLNGSPNPDRIDEKKIPMDIMLSCHHYSFCSAWTGQWIEYRFKMSKGVGEYTIPSNMVIHPDGDFLHPKRVIVAVPAMIYKFIVRHNFLMAIVRYFGFNGEVCEGFVYEEQNFEVDEPKHIQWVFRHRYNKILKHIRRWREHLRYKPGGDGYKLSKESFDNLKCLG